jgi:quinol monooxygenase YgiN
MEKDRVLRAYSKLVAGSNHNQHVSHRIYFKENSTMAKLAIWVMLKAKPGKEADVEAFLKQGAVMSKDEAQTVNWYGVKMGPGIYGVFDTFNDEDGRDAHLNGEIARALMANASELFSNEIRVEKMEILADK